MRKPTEPYLRAIIIACIFWRCYSAAGDPGLGAPVVGIVPGAAQLGLINCTDTNFQYVVQTSINLQDWMPVTTNFATASGSPVTVPATDALCFYRLMLIPHLPAPIFQYAIMVKSNFMNSNSLIMDSFDSGSDLYSTGGKYDPTKRKAGADVATDSPIIGSLSITNALIFGHVFTGPGTAEASVQISSNSAVGDATWNATNSGIEPGCWSGNFFVNFPDVPTPTASSWITPRGGTVNGTTYTYVLSTNNGNYKLAALTLSGNNALIVTGTNVTLYVPGTISISGNSSITISSNASLSMYVGGVSATFSGNGIINLGNATQFAYYGLPSNTSVRYAGITGLIGTVYAPEAVYGLSGNSDYYGAAVAEIIVKYGSLNIHYDENLKVNGPTF